VKFRALHRPPLTQRNDLAREKHHRSRHQLAIAVTIAMSFVRQMAGSALPSNDDRMHELDGDMLSIGRRTAVARITSSLRPR